MYVAQTTLVTIPCHQIESEEVFLVQKDKTHVQRLFCMFGLEGNVNKDNLFINEAFINLLRSWYESHGEDHY